MKKVVIVLCAAAVLGGCASKETIDGQVSELKALDAYHDAERKDERAKKTTIVAGAALAAAVANQVVAKKELEARKTELLDLLSEGSKDAKP